MKKYLFSSVLLILSLYIISCSKNSTEPDTTVSYQKIAEGYVPGIAVKAVLYAKTGLTTGYNQVFIALSDSASAQTIEQAQVMLMPMMDMGTMKHAAPVENPQLNAAKLFAGAVIFTMPSGTMGSWTLDITVMTNGKTGKLTLPLTITEPTTKRIKSFISKVDNAKFFIALLEPQNPKVGVNDMEIAIYKSKSMMEFPADSSLSVTLTPEMPTMGHGSPNNMDPVHVGKGHYKGKVNFTMTGLWYLHLDTKAGNAIADTATYFEINF